MRRANTRRTTATVGDEGSAEGSRSERLAQATAPDNRRLYADDEWNAAAALVAVGASANGTSPTNGVASASTSASTLAKGTRKRKRAMSLSVAAVTHGRVNGAETGEQVVENGREPLSAPPTRTQLHSQLQASRTEQISQDVTVPSEVEPVANGASMREHRKSTPKNFDKVNFGRWQIKPWYHSPYPLASSEEDDAPAASAAAGGYNRARGSGRSHGRRGIMRGRGRGRGRGRVPVPVPDVRSPQDESILWVCERCFKYMREGSMLELHSKTCHAMHPPGKKVYKRGAHIIWEIDGAKEKLFCQNLSLFGKLFIDIKTLFFDCENFMFYVLTEGDGPQDFVIGFFSKEKLSYDGYNLACIVTFPPFQRKRYGMLMIEFSYELSRRAGKFGTPERPLSELGLRSYLTYWIGALVQFFRRVLTVRPVVDTRPHNYEEPVDNDLIRFIASQQSNGHVRKRRKSISSAEIWEGETANMYHSRDVVAATSGANDILFSHMRWMRTTANSDGSATTHVFARCSLEGISAATGLRVEDVAFALHECGLLRRIRALDSEETEEVIVISREMVEKVAQEFNVKKMCMEVHSPCSTPISFSPLPPNLVLLDSSFFARLFITLVSLEPKADSRVTQESALEVRATEPSTTSQDEFRFPSKQPFFSGIFYEQDPSLPLHSWIKFFQSPTVVQSPASPSATSHCKISSPVTPVLKAGMNPVPFESESFSGTIRSRQGCDGVSPTPNYAVIACTPGRKGGVNACDDSFRIQRITNIKEIDPQWEHDEIEEIMVISPRAKNRSSFLDLGTINHRPFSISNFETLQVVGKESSTQTVIARSCVNSGIYAIKTTRKCLVSSPTLLSRICSEQACLRVATEGGSPFLPKLYRSFQDETRLYMILDTFPGGSIATYIDREGPLPPSNACFYASEIVEALSHLHSLCIVHRDVKPENIMIAADGHIILNDFSCAKMINRYESEYFSATPNCVTKEFEAPERLLGWSYDFAVDVWSFGILLCVMHFGQHPFLEGDELDPLLIMQKRILRGQAPNHPSHCIPLSEWRLIRDCLQQNPCLRPNLSQAKAHEYFSGVDWAKIKTKGYPAPYFPPKYYDGAELDHDEVISSCGGSDLLEPNDGLITDSLDFDGYTFVWDFSSGGCEAHRLAQDGSNMAAFKDACNGYSFPAIKDHVRSILKSPSLYFPGDPTIAGSARPESFLDLRRSTPGLGLCTTPERTGKLRKKKLSTGSTPVRSLIPSARKSVSSIFSEVGIGICREREKSTLRKEHFARHESPETTGTLNLPKGVVQSGRGIGFTYVHPASQSRLSPSSVTPRSCFSGFSTLVKRFGGSSDDLEGSKDGAVQKVYGNTWSVHTNEAQMSNVTFGMPDGLGHCMESVENFKQ
ncbi:hypothetical protein M0805_000320 [Coniferiporia weirii]|nr:hypothetical protein M0805_000320 [Coniferiporia weirii]